MAKPKPFVVDLDALPPSMRPKDHVVPESSPHYVKQLTTSPLRQILAEREANPQNEDHVPTAKTREGVMYAIGLGIDRKIVARIVGIPAQDLERLYSEELETAQHILMNDVQTNMYNIARDPHHSGTVRAAMYLLDRLGGPAYRPINRTELSGPDGRPLQIDQQTRTIDPALLTQDQRDALREILTSAMRLAQPVEQPTAPTQAIEGRYSVDHSAEDLLQ